MKPTLIINPTGSLRTLQNLPKMSKILFKVIPFDFIHSYVRPSHAVRLASYLAEKGYECDILDLATCIPFKRKKILKKFIDGYEYFVFSSHFHHYSTIIEFAKFCKDINPNVKIVVEQFVGSFMYKEVLDKHLIDFALIGESEKPLLDLVSGKKLSEIDGIAYKKNGKIYVNPKKPIKDLDSLPFPAWEKCKPIHFKYPPRYSVLASRGCPMRCIFCPESRWYSYPRFRDPKKVVDELEILSNSKNLVGFSDPNFSISKKNVKRICEEIKNRKLEFSQLIARCHIDFVDIEILKMMKSAGFTDLYVGVESLLPVSLKFLNKTKNPIGYIKKCKMLLRYSNQLGLKVASAYLIPLPGQTKQNALNEIRFLKQYSDVAVNYLTPFPGTPLWNKMKNMLITRDFSLFDTLHLVIKSHMKKEEIKEIHDYARPPSQSLKNYLDCIPIPAL
ncbi:MAG: radical SAM protein [Candidatus Aenigmarchaeota archaeon]|nr:radical SAM protein [Candidatus Aenigmarchaeota archaeon]